MPLDYSIRLVEFQGECRAESKEIIEESETTKRREGDIRDCLRPSDPVDIVWPLSSTVLGLLEETSQIAEPLPDGLPQRMLDLVRTSEVIWKSPVLDQMMVFKCDTDVVVKAIWCVDDDTEYTTLQYLECHKPDIPAPRPLGYV
ncbi:hypothetical protein D8B26_006644 [Coccidioides posadasii str. Silveira]|uniref:uncharacterized protein n=1 Tax=Coccidioides posadasii (strain RMSCC 757 / Silveira) TaxID=443226 RepID=UPI001BF15BC6|nr:hypothetical protein D8B26_006644 [Coccidioides posadasii str. Silveira]